MECQLLRCKEVLKIRGVGRSTHFEHVKQGLCTRPLAIGARATAWPASEITAINCARIAGKGDAEIRALVEQLHAQRASALDAVLRQAA